MNCRSCKQDTAGNHEWDCPMHRRHWENKVPYEQGKVECPNCATLRRELEEAKRENERIGRIIERGETGTRASIRNLKHAKDLPDILHTIRVDNRRIRELAEGAWYLLRDTDAAVTDLCNQLEEARGKHQDAELRNDKILGDMEKISEEAKKEVEGWSRAHDYTQVQLEPALACCNAFLDTIPVSRGNLSVKMWNQQYDHITRLALEATGREK